MTPMLVTLRALKVGDLLVAVPALRALDAAFPDHRRTLCAPAVLAPLVRRVGLDVEVVDTGEHGELDHALAEPDQAVNLHGRGPASTDRLRALRPRHLISFGVTSRWDPDEHERMRWCRLLTEAGVPADPEDFRIDGRTPASATGHVVVHPGASSAARRWPAERWAAVAAALTAEGHDVVVTGGCSEVGLAHRVARLAGLRPCAVAAGRTSLVDLVDLLARARAVTCGDTGVAHLATALGTPSVVLFGPTSPALWGPPADGPHVAIWTGSSGDPHARDVDAGLLGISVDEALTALRRVVDAPSAGAR